MRNNGCEFCIENFLQYYTIDLADAVPRAAGRCLSPITLVCLDGRTDEGYGRGKCDVLMVPNQPKNRLSVASRRNLTAASSVVL